MALEKLGGDLTRLVVLVVDIIVSFVLAGIFFNKNNHPGATGHGIGALVVFVVFGLVYIVIVVVYYINKWQTAEEKSCDSARYTDSVWWTVLLHW